MCGRGSSQPPTGTRSSSRRCSPCSPRAAARRVRRAADHPGASAGAPRPARRGRARVIGRGAVEGKSSTAAPSRSSRPSRARRRPSPPADAGPQGADPPRPAEFPDDEAFRFRHLLIRDAAYDSLPKETRAELHERFADWLDGHAALVEQDEIVGYHLERAYRNRAELDNADPRSRRARPTAESAGGTARGAAERGDISAFCGLWPASCRSSFPTAIPSGSSAVRQHGPLLTVGRGDEALVAARELAHPRTRAFNRTGTGDGDGRPASRAVRRAARGGARRRGPQVFEAVGDDNGLVRRDFLRSQGLDAWACRAGHGAAKQAEAHGARRDDSLAAHADLCR